MKIEITSENLQECKNKFRIEEHKLKSSNTNYTKSFPKAIPVNGLYKGVLKILDTPVEAHKVYTNKSGERLPSVTTILKKTIPLEDFLLDWSNGLGFKRINYRKYMQVITEKGQFVHNLIEHYTKNRLYDIDTDTVDSLFMTNPLYAESRETVYTCFSQFIWWYNALDEFELVSNEESFVSENHNFGGTIDMVCRIDGKLTILDLKTSSALDSKMLLQLAAYTILYEENTGERVDQVAVLRLDKENVDACEYFVVTREDVQPFTEYFLNLLDHLHLLDGIGTKFHEMLGTKVYYKK
ncbi:MAG: PD-(D/E)XK nuclease family protein [Paraclostridium sp.]